MTPRIEQQFFLRCSCGIDGLRFWFDESTIWVERWSTHPDDRLSWPARLRAIRSLIVHGTAPFHEIVIEQHELNRLASWIFQTGYRWLHDDAVVADAAQGAPDLIERALQHAGEHPLLRETATLALGYFQDLIEFGRLKDELARAMRLSDACPITVLHKAIAHFDHESKHNHH